MKLGDDNKMHVEGRGIKALTTSENMVRILNDEHYVPKLAHNLMSVGLQLGNDYPIMLDNGACLIKDRESRKLMTRIQITRNPMFPWEV